MTTEMSGTARLYRARRRDAACPAGGTPALLPPQDQRAVAPRAVRADRADREGLPIEMIEHGREVLAHVRELLGAQRLRLPRRAGAVAGEDDVVDVAPRRIGLGRVDAHRSR